MTWIKLQVIDVIGSRPAKGDTMKAVIVLVVLALLQQANLAQSPTTIDGVVLESKTDRPIEGANVTIIPEGVNPASSSLATTGIRVGVTDSQGHFAITEVMPGRYRVVPERNGFVFAFPTDTKEAREPGVWIQVGAGQTVKGIQLHITPKAVISGRVLDVKGNAVPANAASVSLMQYRYDDSGKKRLSWVPGITYGGAGSFVRVNDKGEYRFFNLPAGDYRVSVSGGPFSIPSSPTVNVPFYYPGTTDETKAEIVHVEAGDEIDLGTMLFHQVNAVMVQFRFTNLDGVQQTPGAIYFGTGGAYFFSRAQSQIAIPLASGHYDLLMPAAGSYARVTLDVGTTDIVQDVEMKLAHQVGAHLYWEDDAGQRAVYRPGPSQFNCRLLSSTTPASPLCSGRDGEYRIGFAAAGFGATPSVPPDSYRLELTQLPPGTYVREATIDGKDVRKEPFRIDSDSDIDIVLSASSAVVNGFVVSATGAKLPDAIVALVPDGSLRSVMDLYRTVVTDVNGGFEIQGIAPGDYHLFAWPDLPGAAYRNADFMKKYDDSGVPLTINKDSHISHDVTAFKSSSD